VIINFKNKIIENKTFIFNLLIIETFSHVFYKVSYDNFLLRDFEMNIQILNNIPIDLYRTELESPFNTLLIEIFNLSSPDGYKAIIYIIFQITLILICKNLAFLNKHSSIFLLGGWLVAISWWVGFVENISVLLMILYFKNYIKGDYKRFYIYLFLLGINHFGHALFSTIVFLILINFEKLFQSISTLSLSLFVLSLYKKYIINFGGRGRFRFIFNQNTLDDGTSFISNNLQEFYWSGFMGISFILLFIILVSDYETKINYIGSLVIATIGAAITTDSTRNFSILVVPLLLHLIMEFKQYRFENIQYKNYLLFTAFISNLIVGVHFVHGQVWKNSPNVETESIYNFFARMVNWLMKDIWT
jgi:hypothetical protein